MNDSTSSNEMLRLAQEAVHNPHQDSARTELLRAFVENKEAGHLAALAHFLRCVLKDHRGDPVDVKVKAMLLDTFGDAFGGDEVGDLGHDLLLNVFHRELRVAEEHFAPSLVWVAALNCLATWLPDDEEHRWRDMLDGMVRKTASLTLAYRVEVERLALEWLETSEETSEAGPACPSCGSGDDIQRYPDCSNSWFCPDCGKIWDGDGGDEEGLLEDEEEPEAWTKLRGERGSTSTVKAYLERRHIPDFLGRLLDVHEHLSLALLESLDVGHLCVGAHDLELLEIGESDSLEPRVLAVLRGGRRGFSIEPPTSTDRYLVLAFL